MNLATSLTMPDPRPGKNTVDPSVISEETRRGKGAVRRVLIVEDEIFIALDLERQMIAAGFEVVGRADNASDALRLAEQELPDAILMDIRLKGPRLGTDVALELWRRFQLRCVFVSGNIDDVVRNMVAPAKPYGFVSKPFVVDDIIALLHP